MSKEELFIFEDIVQYYKDELNPHKLITSHIKYWWYYFTAFIVSIISSFFIIEKNRPYLSLTIFTTTILIYITFLLFYNFASKKVLKEKYNLGVKGFKFDFDNTAEVKRIRTSRIQDFLNKRKMLTSDVVMHLIEYIPRKKQHFNFFKYFTTGLFLSATIPLYVKFLDWKFSKLSKIGDEKVYFFIYDNLAIIIGFCLIAWEIKWIVNINIDRKNKRLDNLIDHLNSIYLNLTRKT